MSIVMRTRTPEQYRPLGEVERLTAWRERKNPKPGTRVTVPANLSTRAGPGRQGIVMHALTRGQQLERLERLAKRQRSAFYYHSEPDGMPVWDTPDRSDHYTPESYAREQYEPQQETQE